jgi:hypothetical protein
MDLMLIQQIVAGGAAAVAAAFGLLVYLAGRRDSKRHQDKQAKQKLEAIKRHAQDIERSVRTSSDADVDERLRKGGWFRQ